MTSKKETELPHKVLAEQMRKKQLITNVIQTIMLSGPILWVILAKLMNITFDKLYQAALLSIPTALLIGYIWTKYVTSKQLIAYLLEIERLKAIYQISEETTQNQAPHLIRHNMKQLLIIQMIIVPLILGLMVKKILEAGWQQAIFDMILGCLFILSSIYTLYRVFKEKRGNL